MAEQYLAEADEWRAHNNPELAYFSFRAFQDIKVIVKKINLIQINIIKFYCFKFQDINFDYGHNITHIWELHEYLYCKSKTFF